jgi:aspartyl-tRNA(Asn)/glutamyl-tRNA(Gln) amidotransferase subunit B
MNSLRSLGRAIDYEAARQVALLCEGERIIQQTRHWDETAGRTESMRSKEEANDYRYFAEPDLVPLDPSPQWRAAVIAALPVLPAERRARVASAAGLAPDSDGVVTVVRLDLDPFVTAAMTAGADGALAVKRLSNEVAAEVGSGTSLDPDAFVRLLRMESLGELTTAQARTVLKTVLVSGGDPAAVARELGFEALGSDELAAAVDRVITEHPAEWERFAGGEDKLQGLFMGKIKGATGGKADLKAAGALLRMRRAQ